MLTNWWAFFMQSDVNYKSVSYLDFVILKRRSYPPIL